MLGAAKGMIKEAFAAIVRVVLIFLVLTIAVDASTRMYYSYMPINRWMDFTGIKIIQEGEEPYVVITRRSVSPTVSMFHRTLLIKWPEDRRGCTMSTTVVADDPDTTTVTVPLDRMLSVNCPDVLGKGKTNAILQVSYLFDFPYGVKRMVVRYSDKFSIWYDGTNYHVGTPLSNDELANAH
jgi:hypothetical protein